MTETYECSLCHGVFEYGWSDDLATKELHQNFGEIDKADCGIVCDDCFQQTGFFCGPPQDPFKDIPKPIREIFRHHFDEVAEKVRIAIENNILYGIPLSLDKSN